MDDERRFSIPVVGGSSLLVIFAVLCLTVFSLLAMSTVQAGSRLSRTAAQAVADYYEADCRAEEVFARLRAGEVPEGVTQTEDLYFYTCPISDTLQLRVELCRGAEGWSVLCWQAESTAHWENDGGLDLWDGT